MGNEIYEDAIKYEHVYYRKKGSITLDTKSTIYIEFFWFWY